MPRCGIWARRLHPSTYFGLILDGWKNEFKGFMPDGPLEIGIVSFPMMFRLLSYLKECIFSEKVHLKVQMYNWQPTNYSPTSNTLSIINMSWKVSQSTDNWITLNCSKWRKMCFISIDDITDRFSINGKGWLFIWSINGNMDVDE